MSEAVKEQARPGLEGLAEYAGRWVAIRDGKVIAAADSLEQLRENPDVRREDTVYVVPEPSSYFY